MTKAEKIRSHKEANPKASMKEIAKACEVSYAYVYQTLHPKEKAKKLPKAFPIQKKEKNATDGQKIVRGEINRLHAELANLRILDEVNEAIIKKNKREIDQLKNDVVGYRAVISYLQGQLDGATV